MRWQSISNLNFVSKLTERSVINRFNLHVNQHHLLLVHQSAYQPIHSIETAIAIVHNDIEPSKMVTSWCLYSWILALPLIRSIMPFYLKCFGVKNIEFEWFRSYLSDQTQSFCVASQKSASVQIIWAFNRDHCLAHISSLHTRRTSKRLMNHSQ